MEVSEKQAANEAELGLTDQVALVTGAAKGLGAAITDVLASDGAHVVLSARDVDALHDQANRLDGKYTQRDSLVVRCDVSREHEVDDLIEQSIERFGGIDIVVNAAGVIGPIETPAHEVTPSEFRNVLEVNLVGTFLVCRAVIPHMIPRGRGRIVNIAGTSGLRGYRNRVAYSSSKWAVRGLTRTLALELGQYEITVNSICPGVTHGRRMNTIIQEKARKLGLDPEDVYLDYTRQTALGRFIEDSDIAAAVRFLVSEGARNITGQEIVVDAGWDV